MLTNQIKPSGQGEWRKKPQFPTGGKATGVAKPANAGIFSGADSVQF
jgi:hypothetical protein